MEAAIHGLAPGDELTSLSVPAERDARGGSRTRIVKSEDDAAVLFIARSLEEASILSGVVDRLCDTGVLVRCAGEDASPAGSQLVGARCRRTDKRAPRVTRWLGGHGTRSQQAIERRGGTLWPAPDRWRGVSP